MQTHSPALFPMTTNLVLQGLYRTKAWGVDFDDGERFLIKFERLRKDKVGPAERSKSGNDFLLVITEYATRYPEVFPLKMIKVKSVALCIVELLERVGKGSVIIRDQGTNFMSNLLKDKHQLLGIKGLRTTPYHILTSSNLFFPCLGPPLWKPAVPRWEHVVIQMCYSTTLVILLCL